MLQELDPVVLMKDVPEAQLIVGDTGSIVHVYSIGRALEIEVVSLSGETIAIVTLPTDAVRAVAAGDVPHAPRKLGQSVAK